MKSRQKHQELSPHGCAEYWLTEKTGKTFQTWNLVVQYSYRKTNKQKTGGKRGYRFRLKFLQKANMMTMKTVQLLKI